MSSIQRNAYGKVNLLLNVVRRLENGYHQVEMVMQTVDLHDVVTLTQTEDTDIQISCGHADVPNNEDNLAYKAAKAMGIEKGLRIDIQKNIPVAAGMAGGSTDCATVLLGINELYGMGKSMEELEAIGVKLGADVPYCLSGGTKKAEGIGEVLTSIPEPADCIVVLAKPDINVSTKYVYEHLELDKIQHPDMAAMEKALAEKDLEAMCASMGNVLESVTGQVCPIIGQIEKVMEENGAIKAMMSGSGPTVFGIFTDKDKAEQAAAKIREQKLTEQVYISNFVTP